MDKNLRERFERQRRAIGNPALGGERREQQVEVEETRKQRALRFWQEASNEQEDQ